jgi:hypothetical protein
MCEILGGSLSGTGATDPKRGRFANGMLSFYVDPKVFDAEGFFPTDIAKYVSFVKGSRPATPGVEILGTGRAGSAHPRPASRRRRAAAGRHMGCHRGDRALGRPRRATHPTGDDVGRQRPAARCSRYREPATGSTETGRRDEFGAQHALQRTEATGVGDHAGLGQELRFGNVPEAHDDHLVAEAPARDRSVA